jgi:hypothetical protein
MYIKLILLILIIVSTFTYNMKEHLCTDDDYDYDCLKERINNFNFYDCDKKCYTKINDITNYLDMNPYYTNSI